MYTEVKKFSRKVMKKSLHYTFWKSEKAKRLLLTKKYNAIERSQEVSENTTQYSELYKRLSAGDVKRIKLIGDSITAGVGVLSYYENKKSKVIFDNKKGEVYYEPHHTILSWSNYFRHYVNKNFPSVDLINCGIGGKSAKWVNTNKDYLINNNEDIVFVMLGTNDRWDSSSLDEYKTNLEELLDNISNNSKLMYVLCPPPTLNDNRFSFGMDEINKVVKAICEDQCYNYISFYDHLMEYSKNNNIELDKMFETTGSHPVQKGYDEMWRYLGRELTLITES